MGIPKPLWSSEAPRRILFKTPSSHPDPLKGNISGKEGEWGEVRNFLTITPGDSGHQESLGTITYGKGQFNKMLLIVTGICGPWCRAGRSPGLPLCFPAPVYSLLQITPALPSCPLAFHSPTSALRVQSCPL